MAKFTYRIILLIPGIKAKINDKGEITDSKTASDFSIFIDAYKRLVEEVDPL